MYKKVLTATIISLFFVSYANAWEMDAYVENTPITESHVDTNSRTNQDSTSATKADNNQKDDFRHHSIGIEYNFLTLTDFGTSLSHLFDDKCEDIFECSYGAISINYGYIFSNNIETGLIANISLTKNPLYSLMGKFKFNGVGRVIPWTEDCRIFFQLRTLRRVDWPCCKHHPTRNTCLFPLLD